MKSITLYAVTLWLASMLSLASIFYPTSLLSQNHPNGIDFIGPDGLTYPNFTFAGYQGGIPSPAVVATVQKGTGNDRDEFIRALNAAIAAGGGAIYIPNGVYELSDGIYIPNTNNIVFRGQSKENTIVKLMGSTSNKAIFHFESTTDKISSAMMNVTQVVPRGATRIPVDKPERANVGDWVKTELGEAPEDWREKFYGGAGVPLGSANVWFRGVHQVVGKEGNILILDKPIRVDWDPAQDFRMKKFTPVQNVGVENMTLESIANHSAGGNGVGFIRVVNGFVYNVRLIRPVSQAIEFRDAAHIEVRDSYMENPWRQGGGGNGYGGLMHCFDCLWDNTNTKDMRHAPNLQELSYGCVIRNSTFLNSDAHWHARWPRENLLENIVVQKGTNGKPYMLLSASNFNQPSTGLFPAGERNVVYNCDIHGGQYGAGVKLGGLEEEWVFAYNRFYSPLNGDNATKPMITLWSFQERTTFKSNVFYTDNENQDKICAVLFMPGYIPGVGISGKNIHEGMTPPIAGTPGPDLLAVTPYEGTVDFIDNTFYGFTEDRRWVDDGSGGFPNTDLNNEFFDTYSEIPERPSPPVASIYEWQIAMKNGELTSLPVELVSFEATGADDAIALSWVTKDQVGFSHFEVEKSTDGLLFETFQNVRSVESGEKNSYGLVDKRVNEGVLYYYRLKMVDLDGNFSYSQVVNARLEGDPSFALDPIWPNPSQGNIHFRYFHAGEEPMQVEVFDFAGRKIFEQSFSGEQVDATLPLGEKGLQNGLYYVSFRNTHSVMACKPFQVLK